jgi:hypothetical protein
MRWLVHHCIAHPLWGLFPRSGLAIWFHDITAPAATEETP